MEFWQNLGLPSWKFLCKLMENLNDLERTTTFTKELKNNSS